MTLHTQPATIEWLSLFELKWQVTQKLLFDILLPQLIQNCASLDALV